MYISLLSNQKDFHSYCDVNPLLLRKVSIAAGHSVDLTPLSGYKTDYPPTCKWYNMPMAELVSC